MKEEKRSKEQIDYDTWRLKKIAEIKKQMNCNVTQATIIFLLQDISYKLSHYYNNK